RAAPRADRRSSATAGAPSPGAPAVSHPDSGDRMADAAVRCVRPPGDGSPGASPPDPEVYPVTRPVVLLAEELSPATIEVFGDDADVRHVDGTDRTALVAAVAGAD